MKIASIIARYLLGFMFTVFGLNGFLHFIHQPPQADCPGDRDDFSVRRHLGNEVVCVNSPNCSLPTPPVSTGT